MNKWNIQANRFVIPAVDGELTSEQVIEITDEQFAVLKDGVASGNEIYVDGGMLKLRPVSTKYPQEFYDQQETNIDSRRLLSQTDWKVIRELERLYLAGTSLNLERDAARAAVVAQQLPAQE